MQANYFLNFIHSLTFVRKRQDRRWRSSNSNISTTTTTYPHLPPPLPFHRWRKKNCYRTEKSRVDFRRKFSHTLIHLSTLSFIMCSLFCCLLCHLVVYSKWLLSLWGGNVELLMCLSVSQLTFLHCFLFCH